MRKEAHLVASSLFAISAVALGANSWDPGSDPSFTNEQVEHPIGGPSNDNAPIDGWLGRLDDVAPSNGPPVVTDFQAGIHWEGADNSGDVISANSKNHTLTVKHFWTRSGTPTAAKTLRVAVSAVPTAEGHCNALNTPFQWSPTITIKDEQPVVKYVANGSTHQLGGTFSADVRANAVGSANPNSPGPVTRYGAGVVPPTPPGQPQNPNAAVTGAFSGEYTLPPTGNPSAVTIEYKVNITGCACTAQNADPDGWKQFLAVSFTSDLE